MTQSQLYRETSSLPLPLVWYGCHAILRTVEEQDCNNMSQLEIASIYSELFIWYMLSSYIGDTITNVHGNCGGNCHQAWQLKLLPVVRPPCCFEDRRRTLLLMAHTMNWQLVRSAFTRSSSWQSLWLVKQLLLPVNGSSVCVLTRSAPNVVC